MSNPIKANDPQTLENEVQHFLDNNMFVDCPKIIVSSPFTVIMIHDCSALIISESTNKTVISLLTMQYSGRSKCFKGMTPVLVTEVSRNNIAQYSSVLTKIAYEHCKLEREHEVYDKKGKWFAETPHGNLKFRKFPVGRKFSLMHLKNMYNEIKNINDTTEVAKLSASEKQKLLKKDYSGVVDIVKNQLREEKFNALIKKEILDNTSDVSTAEIVEKISSENPELFA